MYPVEESEGVNMLLSKEVTLRKRKNEAYWHLREATTLKLSALQSSSVWYLLCENSTKLYELHIEMFFNSNQ
jgi:hypothetical protein